MRWSSPSKRPAFNPERSECGGSLFFHGDGTQTGTSWSYDAETRTLTMHVYDHSRTAVSVTQEIVADEPTPD